MKIRRRKQSAFLALAIGAITLTAAQFPAAAFGNGLLCAPQETATTMAKSAQPVLARLRTDCPLLGSIVEELVWQDLGEAFPRETMHSHKREIVKELLYLTTVYAGVPKAIEATRALSDILSERSDQCADRSGPVESRQF